MFPIERLRNSEVGAKEDDSEEGAVQEQLDAQRRARAGARRRSAVSLNDAKRDHHLAGAERASLVHGEHLGVSAFVLCPVGSDERVQLGVTCE